MGRWSAAAQDFRDRVGTFGWFTLPCLRSLLIKKQTLDCGTLNFIEISPFHSGFKHPNCSVFDTLGMSSSACHLKGISSCLASHKELQATVKNFNQITLHQCLRRSMKRRWGLHLVNAGGRKFVGAQLACHWLSAGVAGWGSGRRENWKCPKNVHV